MPFGIPYNLFMFQSYQSKQINPDKVKLGVQFKEKATFQSYQSKQINPDLICTQECLILPQLGFQSYQSKQINPDLIRLGENVSELEVSIVSIQTDQSRHYR